MTTRKQRLTVTVDPDLVEAGTRAVAEGEAESLSGWVSSALAEKVQRDQRLAHLRAAIGDYEAGIGYPLSLVQVVEPSPLPTNGA